MAATSTQWQLARESAERYEKVLVPSILGPAAALLVEWAEPQPGETVLDIGCGTGAAARTALAKVGPTGRVIGIDENIGMLEVAKSLPSNQGIEWRQDDACQLPFDDQTVDAVVCAQTLQFIRDRLTALVEMKRVLKPDGRLVLSLWRDIQENPYFHALVEAVSRHISPEVARGLGAAFRLSKTEEIHGLLAGAGFRRITLETGQLDLDLPQLEEFVPRHISATPMAQGFKAAPVLAQTRVVQEVGDLLDRYAVGTGVSIPFRTHLALGFRN